MMYTYYLRFHNMLAMLDTNNYTAPEMAKVLGYSNQIVYRMVNELLELNIIKVSSFKEIGEGKAKKKIKVYKKV